MPVLSESTLRALAGNVTGSLGPQTRRVIAKSVAKTSVFLSHSSRDKDLALLAKSILEKNGNGVYIDWLDEELPPTVSVATADKLRTAIGANSHFLLLATNNSAASRWVPWELGLADGMKRGANIAIFEAKRDGETFTGNEYFGLYPKLKLPYTNYPLVESHAGARGTTVEVANWLR